ncbi:AraC family transcriptional regulator [Mucilaginibacter gotjawali]|uniref:Melibiose operon regulatory protein n=2 Tax=Mucilaginibacter gotjawali TaxID=1550579 RepID=A0A125T280_9SPHI|nr:AraC family transcriptional regulator [Mucilaginibacter gotjawali]MBB3057776.1 AraC-like DNA-binding protein [Mucilaginibacter gotjawali]BAU52578.1 Melibiose operon regulatory protein [Mucilaginibacter gotjawali]
MKVLPFTIPVPHDRTIIVLEEVLPHFYTYLHRHAEVQITWIQKGEGTLLAGNSMHAFKDGEIYLIGANLPHLFKSDPAYFQPDSGLEVRTITIFFNPSGKLSALFSLPEMKSVGTFVEQSQNGFKVPDGSYTDTARQIADIQQASGAVQLSLFIELLHSLSINTAMEPLASGNYTHSMSDPEGMRIAAVYNYIMQNYNNVLSLNEVAMQAHLTPTAFCRYFKKHTRHTFVHFVNKIRVNEACKMLVNGSPDSIAAIAYSCGFNSITNFNHVFKQLTGVSPRDYVNSYSKTVE